MRSRWTQDGWEIRPYQLEAVEGFWHGGSGVVVLPCGAGKTIVGAAAMAKAQATTLILVTNTVAARQWRHELLKRTSLTEDEIGEYSGAKKEIRPVTIATYQVMTTRRKGVYAHLELFDSRDWGLIIYDEVHLLPAPIFRFTADIQSRRRLGLTATLVREDGREGDVFSLIGPKRYDAPWKDIEAQGYIAPADCVEVRVTLTEHERLLYATAEPEERYRLASTTETKMKVIEALAARHVGDQLLVIGQYLDQLDEFGERLGVPVIKGDTTVKERERLYDLFRTGEITTLVVSKVANFSIDLPEASVAIQVSGSFGSRQEEAQRLGRIAAAEARRSHCALLRGRRARHHRPGLRRAPPAVPCRTGLRVSHHRRRRRVGGRRNLAGASHPVWLFSSPICRAYGATRDAKFVCGGRGLLRPQLPRAPVRLRRPPMPRRRNST